MRAATIGCVFDDLNSVLREAKLSCAYIHNYHEAIQGAKAVAGCVFLARTGAPKDEIYKLNFSLDSIRSDYKFDSRLKKTVNEFVKRYNISIQYKGL